MGMITLTRRVGVGFALRSPQHQQNPCQKGDGEKYNGVE